MANISLDLFEMPLLKFIFLLVFVLLSLTILNGEKIKISNKQYAPKWEDLDTRPLPQWYDEAKVGIILTWGVFSVPSLGSRSEWFWSNHMNSKGTLINYYRDYYMENFYPKNFTYQEFGPMFTAELFEPDELASLFQRSGAKYIIMTSKHHEGFNLYRPNRTSVSWNSMEVGPRRDLIGELSESVRDLGLKFGVYYSLYEWFNPIYVEDKKTGFKTRNYPKGTLWPDINQLVSDYKPSILWADGDWEAYDTYWNSTGLLAWLYNKSPVKDEIVTNDRWGKGCNKKHGDFYSVPVRDHPGYFYLA